MIRALKCALAKRRLQRMVDANKRSFRVQDYAKRRAAALKFTRPQPRTG